MNFDQDLFKRALDFAAEVHGADPAFDKPEQRVPGSGVPYVAHVVKVAMEVLAVREVDAGCDRNLAVVCALSHHSCPSIR